MAVSFVDMVLFPHCDLHVAMSGAPQLRVTVNNRTFDDAKPDRYQLADVTRLCTFEFIAPHKPASSPGRAGERFDNLPSIDPATGLVTATTPGVYLFQVRWETGYIVGRLQVHDEITAWWFGNDSITTALDVGSPGNPGIAHAQPSIYAEFADVVPTGADKVGDITGHGYVRLTPADPAKLAINPQGRIRGLVETADQPTKISGTFVGSRPLPVRELPVRVFDYAKPHADLFPVQTPDVANADKMHNIVFIPEGFRETDDDRTLFELIISNTVREMFDKPRHQPYAMLEANFNIFKAFVPSNDHYLTCGFRVQDDSFNDAMPIPFNGQIEGSAKESYSMQELVARVGLPMHNESRFDLRAIWQSQSLTNFKVSRVDNVLISAWRRQFSVGILHARDTIFGMRLGKRPADRQSDISDPPVPRPASDVPTDALEKFIARVYEFYNFGNTRNIGPDTRRHPPELFVEDRANPGGAIKRYLGGLKYAFLPFSAIGHNWVPDDTKFKPSRGLVAMIVYDDMHGGTNFDALSVTAQTTDRRRTLAFTYADVLEKREMRRRDPLSQVPFDVDEVANTVAHEFGHSFNLDDEYESSDGEGTAATDTEDSTSDNIAVLGFLRDPDFPASTRRIDPEKLKWRTLPRMTLSARLLVESDNVVGGVEVTIDPRYIGKWVQAKEDGAEVALRNFIISPRGQQLPLTNDPRQWLRGLTIHSVDQSAGRVVLGGAVNPLENYAPGSVVYVPLREGGAGVEAIPKQVQDLLFRDGLPLNRNPDHELSSGKDDTSIDIPGYSPPCNSSRMIGLFEGGGHFAGGHYRPAGTCKMRNSAGKPNVWTEVYDDAGSFCYVCKWLIVNRVDPSYHATISAAFYPDGL